MGNFLTILPLAFVMIAGPQIISAVFLATSVGWRRNSAAYLAGVALAVPLFVTVAYLVAKAVNNTGGSQGGASGDWIDVAVLLLLVLLVVHVFRHRKEAEPPKWMGKLQTATPGFSFKLGFLLLGVFPTDIITSTTVGATLARHGEPLWQCLPFVLLTLFLVALPVLLVLVMGKRANVFLPKARDWMDANSWIVSEVVIVFFLAMTISSLADA